MMAYKHGDTSFDTAVPLKMSEFNTPTMFLLLKNKTAVLTVISKPPLGYIILFGHIYTAAPTTVFFITVVVEGNTLIPSGIKYQKGNPNSKICNYTIGKAYYHGQ